MKIAYVNKFYFNKGGAETVFFSDMNLMKKRSHDTVVFSMKHPDNYLSDFSDGFVSNIDFLGENIGLRKKFSAAVSFVHSREAVSRFELFLDKHSPDIVHFHNIYHQLTPSIIRVAKSRGIPSVLTAHDSKIVCPSYLRLRNSNPCSDCLTGGLYHVLVNRCASNSLSRSSLLFVESFFHDFVGSYRALDAVVAPSQFMANSLKGKIDNIKLIYNAVDTNEIVESSQDGKYIAYFGRLSAEKGVSMLLEAYEASGVDMPLHIYGNGPLLESLKAKNVSGVKFFGHLSGSALQNAMKYSSFVVVPSLGFENCNMVILESMAYGKPVVASNLGGNSELVCDGLTGFLFSPDEIGRLIDKIKFLAFNEGDRRTLGQLARSRAVLEFDVVKHADQLEALYKSLVS